MLWKYKKCYQESSQEAVNPTICFVLETARFNSIILPPEGVNSVYLESTSCDGLTTVQGNLNSGVTVTFNQCIQLDTLSLTDMTIQEVSDAIANNSGLINVPVLDDMTQELVGNVSLYFNTCR